MLLFKTKPRAEKIVELKPAESEEGKLAQQMKISIQENIYETEKLGYKFLTLHEILTIFKVRHSSDLKFFKIEEYPHKIPFGVMIKIKECQDKKYFNSISIIDFEYLDGKDPIAVGFIRIKDVVLRFLIGQWE